MVRVVIAGTAGRMGRELVRCAVEAGGGVRLAGALERAGHEALGRDAGEPAGLGRTGVPVTADVRAALKDADVLIDFSYHTAVPEHAAAAAESGTALVIGTTALEDAETAAVRRAAEAVPVVRAPNMSLGINVLFGALRKAAAVFGEGYRVEIEETHHVHKRDAPSGTALRLGACVAEGRGREFEQVRLDVDGEAPCDAAADRIVIRSHRRGEVVGDHTVRFVNAGETIEFTHHAWSRRAFASGALRAAAWAAGRTPGLYDMRDVLGL
ncbi:MAG: 4-hydroxy-tetrahydrodipicolinate reductase [Lentisphaerae bacterium]|nr:4-hydroxy-tetrahydrodipicolinate reductase [Lentisphaerota bacterium]